MSENRTPVVIVRKDKRLNRPGHLAAFVLTGGASVIVTAAKGLSNAAYNARTRELQAQAGELPQGASARDQRKRYAAEWRAEHVPGSKEYKARHGSA